MSNREIRIVIIYMLMFGLCAFSLGRNIGFSQQIKNNDEIIECQWKLDSCYQQIGDMQDDYDVNNDGLINASDYVAIKNYIMSQDEECFVNGGWTC